MRVYVVFAGKNPLQMSHSVMVKGGGLQERENADPAGIQLHVSGASRNIATSICC